MKVTVGAIKQIVREETERLHEEPIATVSSQDIKAELGTNGETVAQILELPGGPLRRLLVVFIDSLSDTAIDQKISKLKGAARMLGLELGPQADVEEEKEASDEGSSQTSGFQPGESGRATDEGSAQTSGYAGGKAANEALSRRGLRQMIMREASAIVGE